MAAVVRLTVITGPHRGEKFCFRGPARCTLGRAPDCFVQLAGEARDELISRHHCHLEMHVPLIWVRDLGSKNGTFINGVAVRVASRGVQEAVPCTDSACPEAIISSGDILTIGGTSLQVEVVDCPSRAAANENEAPVWKPGEFAKKSCPVPC